MRARIPAWLGWTACSALVAVLAWLGRGTMADVRLLENRASALETIDAESRQDRKDMHAAMVRIEAQLDELIQMHTKP